MNVITERGIVSAYFGSEAEVIICMDNQFTDRLVRCHVRSSCRSVFVGDMVTLEMPAHGKPILNAIIPPENQLFRLDDSKARKTVAHNIDQMLIVLAPLPEPNFFLITQYLVASGLAGISVCLVRNKLDMALAPEALKKWQQWEFEFINLGYSWINVSSETGEGLNVLKKQLDSSTNIFVGASGVGKSSLINAICPGSTTTKVGELSNHGLGNHTTSNTRLHLIGNGGALIDSPGVREFVPDLGNTKHLAHTFPEFKDIIEHCRFRNCMHVKEPDCAVLAAVEKGEISKLRWQHYSQLLNSVS